MGNHSNIAVEVRCAHDITGSIIDLAKRIDLAAARHVPSIVLPALLALLFVAVIADTASLFAVTPT